MWCEQVVQMGVLCYSSVFSKHKTVMYKTASSNANSISHVITFWNTVHNATQMWVAIEPITFRLQSRLLTTTPCVSLGKPRVDGQAPVPSRVIISNKPAIVTTSFPPITVPEPKPAPAIRKPTPSYWRSSNRRRRNRPQSSKYRQELLHFCSFYY